mmetsp:Transcript_38648/g.64183  ORF Transcript_38648/g.64183 Transcript_38648/m.64183 type:complete len:295 (+) Transcript_38648:369-1253(+)
MLEVDGSPPEPCDVAPADDLGKEGRAELVDVETDQEGPAGVEGGKRAKDKRTVAVDGLEDVKAKDVISSKQTAWVALDVVGGRLVAKAGIVPRRGGGEDHVRHHADEVEHAKVPVEHLWLAVDLDEVDQEQERQGEVGEVRHGREKDEKVLLGNELVEQRVAKERPLQVWQHCHVDGWTVLRVEGARELEHHQPETEWHNVDEITGDVQRLEETWHILPHKTPQVSFHLPYDISPSWYHVVFFADCLLLAGLWSVLRRRRWWLAVVCLWREWCDDVMYCFLFFLLLRLRNRLSL